jgi:hypothetical protein
MAAPSATPLDLASEPRRYDGARVNQREDEMPRRRFGRERRTMVRGRTAVLDASTAQLEHGEGPARGVHPCGRGTAHLWRGIMPQVAPAGRAIAVDLVGRGGSTASRRGTRRRGPSSSARGCRATPAGEATHDEHEAP